MLTRHRLKFHLLLILSLVEILHRILWDRVQIPRKGKVPRTCSSTHPMEGHWKFLEGGGEGGLKD